MYMNEWLWVCVCVRACVCLNKLRKKVTYIRKIKHSSFRRGIPKTNMEYCLSITLLDRVFPIKHYDIRHILVYYCLCMLALIFRMIYGENWKKIATARTYSVSVCRCVCV